MSIFVKSAPRYPPDARTFFSPPAPTATMTFREREDGESAGISPVRLPSVRTTGAATVGTVA